MKGISVWEEHLFWLEILEDHAIFVRDHLSPLEKEYIETAEEFRQGFAQLLVHLKKLPRNLDENSQQMITIAKEIWPVAFGYFQFEGKMQKLRIENRVNLNLSPTYLNGTLGENQEYLRLLTFYTHGLAPEPLSLVHLLDLWLEDQLGHIILLRNSLDPIEVGIKTQSDLYAERFQAFILQNHHIKGYLRFSEPGIPRQQELALYVGQTVIEMNKFIRVVVDRYKTQRFLNKTTLRFLEHHFPETCYFIKKLAHYAPEIQNEADNCSLVKPSFS